MKKFNLSLVAVLAMSTFAVAGGDIAPVEEPVVVVPEVVEDIGAFYIGVGYGWQNLTVDASDASEDYNFGSIMIDAGYKFNPYIAVEGRYWFGLSSSNDLGWRNDVPSDITIDSWGLYVKPMYPVTDAFNIYALLGYGSTDVEFDIPVNGLTLSTDADGFSWGIGADYSFTDNMSVFVDYTSLLNDESTTVAGYALDVTVDTWNFGVNYKF